MNRVTGNIWQRLIDRQIVVLGVIVTALVVLTAYLGHALFPFFAAVILAYLMDGLVRFLERRHVPRIIAVFVVFGIFMAGFVLLFVWLIPLAVNQFTSLVVELPKIMKNTQQYVLDLQQRYLVGVESQYLRDTLPRITREFEMWLGKFATQVLGYLPGLLGLFVYLILVPFLIVFFLKDKDAILDWLQRFIPRDRDLIMKIFVDVDRQLGNYVRGKFWEVLIMWSSSTVAFLMLDTRFGVLLGILTGLSTLIPYLGVAVVTLPVMFLAFAQYGFFTLPSMKPIIAYGILQIIDGNILAPVILGISVRLHPTAIIFAVLACGAIWGFWGLFFAVPIAAVVKSLLDYAFPFVRGHEREIGMAPGQDSADLLPVANEAERPATRTQLR